MASPPLGLAAGAGVPKRLAVLSRLGMTKALALVLALALPMGIAVGAGTRGVLLGGIELFPPRLFCSFFVCFYFSQVALAISRFVSIFQILRGWMICLWFSEQKVYWEIQYTTHAPTHYLYITEN